MLKGQAKTDYQRAYMQRRRTVAKTTKPQPQPKVTEAEAKVTALEKELAQAKKRIAELRARLNAVRKIIISRAR